MTRRSWLHVLARAALGAELHSWLYELAVAAPAEEPHSWLQVLALAAPGEHPHSWPLEHASPCLLAYVALC